jgi:LEA14-like dessication related protein
MIERAFVWVSGVLVVALVLPLLLVSCVAPQAELQRVDLNRLTWQQLDVGLLLNLRNPNEFDLPLDQIDWNLGLFDRSMAQGIARPEARIPAQGKELVQVPISVALAQLTGVAESLLHSDRIPWDVGGRCHFATVAGPITVDFSRSGHWNNPLR